MRMQGILNRWSEQYLEASSVLDSPTVPIQLITAEAGSFQLVAYGRIHWTLQPYRLDSLPK